MPHSSYIQGGVRNGAFENPFCPPLHTLSYGTDEDVQDESRIYVESEDQPERMLLETRIGKDDGYQKQQGIIGRAARTKNFG